MILKSASVFGSRLAGKVRSVVPPISSAPTRPTALARSIASRLPRLGLAALACGAALAFGSVADAQTTFSNTTSVTIPGSLSIGPASLFPIPIVVSNLGLTSNVTVSLFGLSHTFPDDLEIALQSPTGQIVMLMANVGATNDINSINLIFSDAALGSLPDAAAFGSGTYLPTSYSTTVTPDLTPVGGPAGPYSTTLSVFNGLNPNGTWNLYIRDDLASDIGSLSGGFSLSITAPVNKLYWTGQSSNTWTGQNWAFDASGTPTTSTPSALVDVFFSADVTANESTVLGQDFTIHSLTVNSPGNVTIAGARTLTVSGDAGTGVTVNAGAGQFVIGANTTLNFGGSSDTFKVDNAAGAIVRGVITGSNGLIKTGTGELTLTGANTYTGGTTISEGSLSIGNNTTTGSILGDVENNALLVFNRSNAYTFSGAITGTGEVRKLGSGTTTLDAATSSYGSLTVRAGQLILDGGDTTLTSTGNRPLFVGRDTDDTPQLVIQNGATLTANQGLTNLVTGASGTSVTVDGTGSSWQTGDQLVIGRNDFASPRNFGLVTVQASGALINDGNIFVGAEGGNGSLLVQTGGTVSTTGAAIIARSADSIGTATVTGAGSEWTIGEDLRVGGFSSGDFGGTGTLNVLAGGNVEVTGRTKLWSTASSITVNGGTFSTGSLTNLDGTAPTIAISDGVTAALTVGTDNTSSFYSGKIVDAAGGAGSLVKTGTGTLALLGASTYTGATTINGGTVLVNGSLGNTATAVNSGAKLGGSGTIGGAIALNSGGTIAPGAGAVGSTLHGSSLTWNGGGTLSLQLGTTSDLLALSGAFAKGTAGAFTVDVTNAGGILNQNHYTLVTFGSQAGFALDASDFTLSTTIAGLTGTFSIDGDSLDLILAITAGGPLLQNSAPVSIPTFADFIVSGAVQTGGPGENNTVNTLTFLPGSSLEVFNQLFVTSGPVNLVDRSSMHLNSSTLSASQLNVLFGGLLHGNGTINGNLYNAGLVSPGNSPGQIYVTGNYQQAPSGTLRIEVGGTGEGEYDRLIVAGHADLDGTLELVRLNKFKLRRGDKIKFLEAHAGVAGEFAHVSNPFTSETILEPTVVYGDHEVTLEVIRGSFEDFADRAGLTPIQRAVAEALDTVSADKPNDEALVYLDERKLNKLPGDFDKIAPEELTSIFAISTSLANVQGLNLQRRTDDLRSGTSGFSASGLAMQGSGPGYSGSWSGAAGPSGKEAKESKEPVPVEEKKWGAFLTGVGEWVDVGGDGNARGYDITTGGFTLGLDYKVCSNFAVGIAAGYAGTAANLTDDGRVWVNGGKLGIYATTFAGGWYADAAVTGGYNSYDTKRSALQGTARGSTEGGELNVLVGTGYDWHIGGLQIGPTATFQYTLAGMDGFTEHGSLAPLEIDGRNAESVRSAIGFKASYDWKLGGVLIKPEIRAAWQHEYGDKSYDLTASFAGGAGDGFLVNGPEIGRDSLLLGAGFAIQCSERCSTYFYYDGELGRDRYDRHSVSGGIRMAF